MVIHLVLKTFDSKILLSLVNITSIVEQY